MNPDLVYYVAVSLDGFIAAPDGSVDWLSAVAADGEDYGYGEFVDGVDAMVIGSRTYEQVLGFGDWPYGATPCWVMSSRALEPAGPDIVVTPDQPAEVMDELARQGVRRAWLVGGGRLAASFRAAGLISEYLVSIIPVVLGGGIPLLAGPGPTELLELVDTRRFDSGVVALRYRRLPTSDGALS